MEIRFTLSENVASCLPLLGSSLANRNTGFRTSIKFLSRGNLTSVKCFIVRYGRFFSSAATLIRAKYLVSESCVARNDVGG